jgi:hypothetical protein
MTKYLAACNLIWRDLSVELTAEAVAPTAELIQASKVARGDQRSHTPRTCNLRRLRAAFVRVGDVSRQFGATETTAESGQVRLAGLRLAF